MVVRKKDRKTERARESKTERVKYCRSQNAVGYVICSGRGK